MKKKAGDDRCFREKHPDFPIYVSAVSLAISAIALLCRFLA